MKLKVFDENNKLTTVSTTELKKLFPQMMKMQDRAMADWREHGAVILLRKGKLKLSKECIGGECNVTTKPSFLHKHVINHSPVGTFHTHFDSLEGAKLSSQDWCISAKNSEGVAPSIECVSSERPRMIACYIPKLTKDGRLTKKAKELSKHCFLRPGVLMSQFYPNYSKLLRKVAEKKYPTTYYEPISYRLKRKH